MTKQLKHCLLSISCDFFTAFNKLDCYAFSYDSLHHYSAQRYMWKMIWNFSDVIQQGSATYVSYRAGAGCQKREINVPNSDARLSSLSKLLNKKGYLGYLPQCTSCLKASPGYPKPTSRVCTQGSPGLLKTASSGTTSNVGKMGESIALEKGQIRQKSPWEFFFLKYSLPDQWSPETPFRCSF